IGSFNDRLIPSHRIAQGPLASDELVWAAMVRLLNGFAKGYAGVRPALADHVAEALNRGASPAVRLYGSVGQSDLGPMADLAHGVLDGSPLEAKEGLGLINNNAFSTAAATLALVDAQQLLVTLDLTAALDLEAFAANPSILHPLVLEARPYPELAVSLRRIRAALAGSYLWEPASARNLQDPLSFRSVLGLHATAGSVLRFACDQTAIELNTSQDNPVVVVDERQLLSMGNHEIQLLATSLDAVRIALAPALTAAAERTVKLLQTHHSGLPEGLAQRAGLAEDGLAEYGVGCQALASEARLLAQPVSFDLVSSSQADGIEDRATNAPLAARRLSEMVSLGERLLAVGLIVSSQAVELRACVLGEGTRRAFELVRDRVRF
ncbi:MAG: aromatic amino acid lyase, partial [Pseudonocardiaceae bacterium]